jgi:hypothetical protein
MRRKRSRRGDHLLQARRYPRNKCAPHRHQARLDKGLSAGIKKRFEKNRKIIYLSRRNTYPAQAKCLFCTKKGDTGAVQFLVERFTFLGFEGQNWMLILIGVVAAFLFFVWRTRDRV